MTLEDWREWIRDERFIIRESPDQICAFEIERGKVFCKVCRFGLKIKHKEISSHTMLLVEPRLATSQR
jgi:hypothetical protein